MLQICSSIRAHRRANDHYRSLLIATEPPLSCANIADARRSKSGAEGIRTPDPLTASQARGCPSAAPLPCSQLTPFGQVQSKDPTPFGGLSQSPRRSAPVSLQFADSHPQWTINEDRLLSARRSTQPIVSAARRAKGRHPRKRTPPVRPSGRQDLNLRPLDPQGSNTNALTCGDGYSRQVEPCR